MNVKFEDRNFQDLAEYIEIKDGFLVSKLDVYSPEELNLCYDKESRLINFGFIFEGEMEKKITGISFKNKVIKNKSGAGGILYSPESKGFINIPGGKRLKIFHVHISPEVLGGYIFDCMDIVPHGLRKIIDGKKDDFLVQHKYDGKIKISLNEVFKEYSNTSFKRLFLESKALELISLELSNLVKNNINENRIYLTSHEKKMVFEAKDMIDKLADENFTVPYIAKEVGLGINKLNSGFKDFFGTTVAGYKSEVRMLKARQMLQSGDFNVSEVAWNIGYTNVSHFCNAFRKTFNVLPGDYKSSMRNACACH